jgi:hypothetical protein
MKSTLLEKLLVFSAAIVGSLMIAGLIALILSLPVWLLWNWLMPAIFGLTQIKLTQAFGLLILSNLLFKSSVATKK